MGMSLAQENLDDVRVVFGNNQTCFLQTPEILHLPSYKNMKTL